MPGLRNRFRFANDSQPDLDFASRISNRSITSSARSKNDSGIVRPSALAFLRLMARSILVGCATGMSAGVAPLRILSA